MSLMRTVILFLIIHYFITSHVLGKGLKFPTLNYERNEKFALKIFETLKNIPCDNVCLWTDDLNSYFVERLVRSLSSKARYVYKTQMIHLVPEPCLHNVVVAQQVDLLFAPGLTLLVQHNVYIIVVNSRPETESMLNLLTQQFGRARVFVVMLANKKVYSLSSPFRKRRRFLQDDLAAMTKPQDFKSVDMGGHKVKVATFNCSPFVVQEKTITKSSLIGIEGELLNEISRMLNFTVRVVTLKGGGSWGSWINHTWKGGVIQAMADNEAEICLCNMWITSRISRFINFGLGYHVSYVTFIIPRPRLILDRFQKFVAVFDWNIWVSITAVYFLCTFCYWLFCNIGVRTYKVPQQVSSIGPVKSGLAMLGMCTLGSWDIKCPNCSTRQLITWWCIFVLLLTAIYSSTISSHLTNPRYERNVNTIKELVELGYHWCDPDYNQMRKKYLFFNLNNYWHREWEKRYVDIPKEEMLRRLEEGRMALPIQRWGHDVVYATSAKQWGADLHKLRAIKEYTVMNYVSLGFSKISPLIYPCKAMFYPYHYYIVLNLPQIVTQHILQAGLLKRYVEMTLSKNLSSYSKQILRDVDLTMEPHEKKLELYDLFPAFFNLILGLFTSLLLFFIELAVGKSASMPKSKRSKINQKKVYFHTKK